MTAVPHQQVRALVQRFGDMEFRNATAGSTYLIPVNRSHQRRAVVGFHQPGSHQSNDPGTVLLRKSCHQLLVADITQISLRLFLGFTRLDLPVLVLVLQDLGRLPHFLQRISDQQLIRLQR